MKENETIKETGKNEIKYSIKLEKIKYKRGFDKATSTYY